MIARHPASFRDASGAVFDDGAHIWRAIYPPYAGEWKKFSENGLLEAARPHLVPFTQLPRADWPAGLVQAHAPHEAPAGTPPAQADPAFPAPAIVLKSPRLPFISYPYEWCFSQLRAAALLTLDLHLLALAHGAILKDATAYNVQFVDGRPVFLDLLSFETWREGQPWQAYGQFCTHFLAPLALMSLRDARTGLFSRLWMDGVPLDLASALLPARSRLSPGLAMHLHLHASMRARHGESRQSAEKAREMRMTLPRMRDVAESLRRVVSSLKPPRERTEWGGYYAETNYTPTARKEKEAIVARAAERVAREMPAPALAADLGANTGEFSRLIAPHFAQVLATDFDHAAVEQHWQAKPGAGILPLVLDLANPSPALGWANKERASFGQRCQAAFLTALAVVHHLRFTAGIPLAEQARWFASLLMPGGAMLVEFVPRDDSQVQKMLARRDDVFPDYSEEGFTAAFAAAGLVREERFAIPESTRSLHLWRLEKKTF